MAESFTFEALRDAWNKLRTDRIEELRKLVPNLTAPNEIYIKKLPEQPDSIVVQFLGLENAVDDSHHIPATKRLIVQWIRKFSMSVQIMRSDPTTLILKISKELKFSESYVDEASVSIFKRDPGSNKVKKVYRCIGGKKNGRRVSNPDDCIGVPDWDKKMNFAKSKRAKYGQSTKAKTKTKLTNIVSKRVRKANARLKKARGF